MADKRNFPAVVRDIMARRYRVSKMPVGTSPGTLTYVGQQNQHKTKIRRIKYSETDYRVDDSGKLAAWRPPANASALGSAQSFFEAGIRASMTDAGIAATDVATYLAGYGTLKGSSAQMLEQIINEKYVANHGVLMEPWTDYRRTGYPTLMPLKTPFAIYDEVPHSLFYPLSEISNNPNAKQKSSMLERVFWDTRK